MSDVPEVEVPATPAGVEDTATTAEVLEEHERCRCGRDDAGGPDETADVDVDHDDEFDPAGDWLPARLELGELDTDGDWNGCYRPVHRRQFLANVALLKEVAAGVDRLIAEAAVKYAAEMAAVARHLRVADARTEGRQNGAAEVPR